MSKHLEIQTPLDRYAIDRSNASLKDLTDKSPINTLGQLRKILKDYPDNTVIALGFLPMWKEGKTPDTRGQKRAHRLIQVKEGTLKNTNKYICLISGQDITDKIWHDHGFIVDDIIASNKETDSQ